MRDYGPAATKLTLLYLADAYLRESERAAKDMLALQQHLPSQKDRQRWLRIQYPKQHKELERQIEALLRDGYEAFYERTLERVFTEHGESWMNLCPHCKALCRTRKAKQCPRCFARWDERMKPPAQL